MEFNSPSTVTLSV